MFVLGNPCRPANNRLQRAALRAAAEPECCSVPDALEDVVKEDRMRVAGVRSPQQDEIGVLDFLVRARASARAKCRRQTDDARACQVRLQLSMLLLFGT